ncbi:MAG: prolipoprotein diacylglyceryl transferase, partial [Lentisphaeria bacterium]|nr:prolipoprotein diacylglyceryl transferase [Lentisphaeria bacterium]
MYPIAFNLFGKNIHFYGVCIALGFICATLVMLYKRNRAGMTKDQIFDLA